jgi:hypothetical protein
MVKAEVPAPLSTDFLCLSQASKLLKEKDVTGLKIQPGGECLPTMCKALGLISSIQKEINRMKAL